MITLMSFVREGKIFWKAFTAYGATVPYGTANEARLAGLDMIREAQ
jgi:hypothetical protein